MSRPVPERTIIIGDNEPVVLRCDHRCMRVLERQFEKSIFSYIEQLERGVEGLMYSATAELAFGLSATHRRRTNQEHVGAEEWMDRLPVHPEEFVKIGSIIFSLLSESFSPEKPEGNAGAPAAIQAPATAKATTSTGDAATT